MNELPSAVAEVEAALPLAQQLFPQSFLVRLGRCLALKEIARYDEATVELRECLRRQPASGIAFDELATVLPQSSGFEDLRQVSTAECGGLPRVLLTGSRKRRRRITNRSNYCKDRCSSLQQAVLVLERSVALRPNHVPSHMTLAKCI